MRVSYADSVYINHGLESYGKCRVVPKWFFVLLLEFVLPFGVGLLIGNKIFKNMKLRMR